MIRRNNFLEPATGREAKILMRLSDGRNVAPRHLSDFAKLVEQLKAAGAVFVSVTPSCAKTRPF